MARIVGAALTRRGKFVGWVDSSGRIHNPDPLAPDERMADLYRQGFMRSYLKSQEKSMKRHKVFDVWDDDGFRGTSDTRAGAERLASNISYTKHPRIEPRVI